MFSATAREDTKVILVVAGWSLRPRMRGAARGYDLPSPNYPLVPSDEVDLYRVKGKSLDELIDDYDRGMAASHGKPAEETLSVGLQYRVAKAQVFWARVSGAIAAVSLVVAIAAVVVAAVK